MPPPLLIATFAVWLSSGLQPRWQRPVPARVVLPGRRRPRDLGEAERRQKQAGDPGQGLLLGFALSGIVWLLVLGLLL